LRSRSPGRITFIIGVHCCIPYPSIDRDNAQLYNSCVLRFTALECIPMDSRVVPIRITDQEESANE